MCAIWSQREQRFITERFADFLTDQGLPEKRELIGNVKTMYEVRYDNAVPEVCITDHAMQDLFAADFAKDLYLVAYVYRRGRLVYEPKKKSKKDGSRLFRRPYGCAAVNLWVYCEFAVGWSLLTCCTDPRSNTPKRHTLSGGEGCGRQKSVCNGSWRPVQR